MWWTQGDGHVWLLPAPECCDKEDLVGENGLGRKCRVKSVIVGGESELKERHMCVHKTLF